MIGDFKPSHLDKLGPQATLAMDPTHISDIVGNDPRGCLAVGLAARTHPRTIGDGILDRHAWT